MFTARTGRSGANDLSVCAQSKEPSGYFLDRAQLFFLHQEGSSCSQTCSSADLPFQGRAGTGGRTFRNQPAAMRATTGEDVLLEPALPTTACIIRVERQGDR